MDYVTPHTVMFGGFILRLCQHLKYATLHHRITDEVQGLGRKRPGVLKEERRKKTPQYFSLAQQPSAGQGRLILEVF
jgi:hypothetical protein